MNNTNFSIIVCIIMFLMIISFILGFNAGNNYHESNNENQDAVVIDINTPLNTDKNYEFYVYEKDFNDYLGIDENDAYFWSSDGGTTMIFEVLVDYCDNCNIYYKHTDNFKSCIINNCDENRLFEGLLEWEIAVKDSKDKENDLMKRFEEWKAMK